MSRTVSLGLPALMAVAAIAAAAPASAAPYAQNWNDSRDARTHYASFGQASDLRRDIVRLDRRIDRAAQNRAISRREARSLRDDVRQLDRQLA